MKKSVLATMKYVLATIISVFNIMMYGLATMKYVLATVIFVLASINSVLAK